MNDLTCTHPDRDCPKIMCGYPLPCPFHTAILHLDKKPVTVEIPITATAALANRNKLAGIGDVLIEEKK